MLVEHSMSLEQEMAMLERASKRPAKRRGPSPEQATQRAIIKALHLAGILAVHIPNEGKRSLNAAMQAKRDGMVKGFPDLALYGRNGRHALFEVKPPSWKAPRAPAIGAKPSDAYQEWSQRLRLYENLRGRGFEVEVVQSVDDALRFLRAWGWVS